MVGSRQGCWLGRDEVRRGLRRVARGNGGLDMTCSNYERVYIEVISCGRSQRKK